MNIKDREEIKEAFGEDINLIRKGNSSTTYYTEGQGKLKPRDDTTPNNIGTDERIMKIATCCNNKLYENPLQFAIAVKGFEVWCEEKNVAPSYAGLSYYLNISKDTLIKYTRDQTEYICYNIIDTVTGEYIYSTNDKKKLDAYISRYYIVENLDQDNNVISSNIISTRDINSNSYGSAVSIKDKINSGEYLIDSRGVTFAEVLTPINNLLEIVNICKAEKARNPAWHIFLAKNNFGRTTQYVDQMTQQITVTNPLDEMSDEEILKAAESRPLE